ncbi:Sulfate adenylyltransferase [Symbiodinium microadriaticum]|uniref:Sulfate adenylyltransferase n=1 Tax=Symbiodinium microadriaticum TaxID=2951 RepID=A0A1Q9DRS4_SYMMI|nr:Sulfate adenylyltransferase [Symbiodinium microadriaticum]
MNLVAIDTLHLFPTTLECAKLVEEKYAKKAMWKMPKGITTKEPQAFQLRRKLRILHQSRCRQGTYHRKIGVPEDEFIAKYGDCEELDSADFDFVSKATPRATGDRDLNNGMTLHFIWVEPFQRALEECEKDILITGRRMDQAAQRIKLDVWEEQKRTSVDIIDYVDKEFSLWGCPDRDGRAEGVPVNAGHNWAFRCDAPIEVDLGKPFWRCTDAEIKGSPAAPITYVFKSFGDMRRPQKRFMEETAYNSVVKDRPTCEEDMRLPEKQLFGLPVTFDLPEVDGIKQGDKLLLKWKGTNVAVLEASSIWKPNKVVEAKECYGTSSLEHPTVASLVQEIGKYYVGGKIHGFELPKFGYPTQTPAEVRATLPENKQVVAFQNRNPIHRAHFELLICAQHLEAYSLGPGDIDGLVRIQTYEALKTETEKEYPMFRWAYLPYSMKMAGPREAIQHMIIRKNYGATHFIIGRDMAGTKSTIDGEDFYGPYDAQETGKKYSAELGVTVTHYENMVYVGPEEGYVQESVAKSKGSLAHPQAHTNHQPQAVLPPQQRRCETLDVKTPGYKVVKLSGTEFRRRLRAGEDIPEHFNHNFAARQFSSLPPGLKACVLTGMNLVAIDTLHLFPTTLECAKLVEEKYAKKAMWKMPKGITTKDEFIAKYGDCEELDSADFDFVSKVEPFQRALEECEKDILITGRRMDQAAQRIKLDVWEDQKRTLNPMANFSWQDIIDYVDKATSRHLPDLPWTKVKGSPAAPITYVFKSFGDMNVEASCLFGPEVERILTSCWAVQVEIFAISYEPGDLPHTTVPVEPHESERAGRFVRQDPATIQNLTASTVKAIDLNERQACDVFCLLSGAFSPLTGFMEESAYNSVVKDLKNQEGHPEGTNGTTSVSLDMRLPEKQLFGLPVTLDLPEVDGINKGDKLLLKWKGTNVAVLEASSIWKPNKVVEAKECYGTSSLEHPTVASLVQALTPSALQPQSDSRVEYNIALTTLADLCSA